MSKREDDFGAAAMMASRSVTASALKSALVTTNAKPAIAIVAKPAMPAAVSTISAKTPTAVVSALTAKSAAAQRAAALIQAEPPTKPKFDLSVATSPIAKEAGIAAAAHQAASTIPDASAQVNPQVPAGASLYEPPPQAQEEQAPAAPQESASAEPDWTPPDTSKALALVPPTAAMVPTAPTAVKESFWSKLLSLFGFGKKKAPTATVHGEGNNLQTMTASVVRRARNGDQNAMALIALIRDNAAKGHPRAVESFEHLKEYVRCNPVDGSNPRIGYEPDYVALTQAPGTRWAGDALGYGDPDYVALTQAPGTRWAGDSTYPDAVALSHGPKLTNPRIGEFLSRFAGEEQQAVAFGIKHRAHASERAKSPKIARAIRMGKIVGQARGIQAVRERGSNIKAFDVNVGWELEGDE